MSRNVACTVFIKQTPNQSIIAMRINVTIHCGHVLVTVTHCPIESQDNKATGPKGTVTLYLHNTKF